MVERSQECALLVWDDAILCVYQPCCFFWSALGSYYPEFIFFEKGDTSFSLILAFNFYRILGGVGVGLASAISPMYIAEVAPSEIRGKLVSCNQFAVIFGMLVVYFVNYMIKDGMTEEVLVSEGWRKMFVSEAYPAAVFGIYCFLFLRHLVIW